MEASEADINLRLDREIQRDSQRQSMNGIGQLTGASCTPSDINVVA